MRTRLLTSAAALLVALLAFGVRPLSSQKVPESSPSSEPKATINRYCVTCHNEKLRTADLLLDKANIENVAGDAEIWEKVIRKLRAGQMPPMGAPRPDKPAQQALIGYLESELDRYAAAHPNPGRTVEHRLNRAEYANAIRDLFGMEIDTSDLLPPDDSSSGFDNIGEVLSVSPVLMERYMLAAGKISRIAVADGKIRPGSQEYKVSQNFVQNDRMGDELPFGSRGGLAVHHIFPVDGEYQVRIRLQRNGDGYIRGLTEKHLLDVRLDGVRVKRFEIGGELRGRPGPIFTRNDPDYRGDPKQVEYEMTADDDLEVNFNVKAGQRVVAATFLQEVTQPEGVYEPPLLLADLGKYKGGEPVIDSITISGPFKIEAADNPVRRQLFVCTPARAADEEPCARQILTRIAHRAYRRPLEPKEIEALMKVYDSGRKNGDFSSGIELALQRVLSGPEFLFRIERDPPGVAPGSVYQVSDVELASRLSFFLWSSIPDDELLRLAEGGKLRDPATLESQVRRMLADPRSKALTDNFAGQWLDIRNLKAISPDPREFPDFDDELRDAFQKETELFFQSMVREDRSVIDLLRADYTFVNERLARHYGIPNIYGTNFRRVTIPGEERRGLLGQGTVLAVTSRANRTSPVLRGKWILENILGTPPPPPPPNVPALEAQKKDKPLTMRQMMEQHRENPACAVCHRIMDPLGFALEHFDAVGKTRSLDAGAPIDASGTLPDGTKFNGIAELRQILLSRPEQFVHTATEKLLTYALGRELHYYDQPAVRAIMREAAPAEYRWSSLILGVVRSTPFQSRRSRDS